MPQLDFDGANSKVSADKIQGQSGTTVTVPTGHKIAGTDANSITINGVNAVAVAPSTSGNVLTSTGSAWASSAAAASGFTMGTVKATTSGTSNTWAGIPSGTTNIILSMHNAYNSGSVELKVQLGDSGGIETTSYKSYLLKITGPTTAYGDTSDSFKFPAADNGHSGHMQFTLVDSSTNTWSCTALFRVANNVMSIHAGSKILSGELTQIQASLSSGAWSGVNGYINIQYS